jgi:hypothetical protein
MYLGNVRQCFALSACFTDHRYVVFVLQKLSYAAAHDFVIIDEVHVQHDRCPPRNI